MGDRKVELLAPAGSPDAFYGAVHAGADAIYLGGDKFGARAYADNFSTEELVHCIRYAHVWGKKVYLTVNTLVKEKEWNQLYDYILPFYEAGLDGVIIQDLGVFLYLKRHFPGMELHISTQMTLTGPYAAAYLKELGATRIVPARELSLQEIIRIKKATGLEIETFIHGAMCYCYSGQCLFSSVLGGRSGNRGRCAQPCRLSYSVSLDNKQSKEAYPLSLKDMCTVEHVPELIKAGIDSFKIEGRMKKPEYAAGVTAVYRKVIDRYYEDPKCFKVFPEELEMLSGLYIRSQRHDGYYHKHNGAEMVTLQNPAYSGSDENLLGQIRREYIEKKSLREVDFYVSFSVSRPACITAVCEGYSVTVTGDIVVPASKHPISHDNIEKQLKKLGDTTFCAGAVHIQLDDNAFYPLKQINELRRQAIHDLENELISSFGLCEGRRAPKQDLDHEIINDTVSGTRKDCENNAGNLTVSVRNPDQLFAVSEELKSGTLSCRRLYIDADLLLGRHAENTDQLLSAIRGMTEIFAVLPYILRDRDTTYLKRLSRVLSETGQLLSGCMVRSLEGYAYLRETKYQGKICADAGFYIWNRETLSYWQDKLDSFCLPWELSGKEQTALLQDAPAGYGEKIVYGRLPMMITANCVARTCFGCHKADTIVCLTDRYRKKFPVEINCTHCMNIIYNSVPLALSSDLVKWSGTAHIRLDFTVENREQTTEIIRYYIDLSKGLHAVMPLTEYTTGHEKRGVE